jgi:hypothetical protein
MFNLFGKLLDSYNLCSVCVCKMVIYSFWLIDLLVDVSEENVVR